MIVLVNYDPAWPDKYSNEAQRLRPAFGPLLTGLHHIGSTAVPGVLAKPVIDILAIVTDVHALDLRSLAFESLGYEVMGEYGLPGRRYFRHDDAAGLRRHHLHTYPPASTSEIGRHLDFRDYLRAHPDTARAYSDLKQALVEQCDDDMRCYSDGKTSFVRKTERRAARWRRGRA